MKMLNLVNKMLKIITPNENNGGRTGRTPTKPHKRDHKKGKSQSKYSNSVSRNYSNSINTSEIGLFQLIGLCIPHIQKLVMTSLFIITWYTNKTKINHAINTLGDDIGGAYAFAIPIIKNSLDMISLLVWILPFFAIMALFVMMIRLGLPIFETFKDLSNTAILEYSNYKKATLDSKASIEKDRIAQNNSHIENKMKLQIEMINAMSKVHNTNHGVYHELVNPVSGDVVVKPLHMKYDNKSDWETFISANSKKTTPKPIENNLIADSVNDLTPVNVPEILSSDFFHTYVSGKTNSGKTTFLNGLIHYINENNSNHVFYIGDKWHHTQWYLKGDNVIKKDCIECLNEVHAIHYNREKLDNHNKDNGGYELGSQKTIVLIIPEFGNYVNDKDFLYKVQKLITQGSHTDIRVIVDNQSFLGKDNGDMSRQIINNFNIVLLNQNSIDFAHELIKNSKKRREMVTKLELIKNAGHKYYGLYQKGTGNIIPFVSCDLSQFAAKTIKPNSYEEGEVHDRATKNDRARTHEDRKTKAVAVGNRKENQTNDDGIENVSSKSLDSLHNLHTHGDDKEAPAYKELSSLEVKELEVLELHKKGSLSQAKTWTRLLAIDKENKILSSRNSNKKKGIIKERMKYYGLE